MNATSQGSITITYVQIFGYNRCSLASVYLYHLCLSRRVSSFISLAALVAFRMDESSWALSTSLAEEGRGLWSRLLPAPWAFSFPSWGLSLTLS
ncbi:hypothetical protein NP493_470g02000 [Ridgeia piscesae]|uniref:Uncharacterized protein n=1 Tax=Ridgeia piscesae TaxID=27915 RepID=A0AAD9NRL5_RIDPI|nr:hypothetical protein NP493_470g02000 [Ridgeia piscesae]